MNSPDSKPGNPFIAGASSSRSPRRPSSGSSPLLSTSITAAYDTFYLPPLFGAAQPPFILACPSALRLHAGILHKRQVTRSGSHVHLSHETVVLVSMPVVPVNDEYSTLGHGNLDGASV